MHVYWLVTVITTGRVQCCALFWGLIFLFSFTIHKIYSCREDHANYSLQKKITCHSQNDVVLYEWYFDVDVDSDAKSDYM